MKTIGKATLLATATLMFCGLADARAQTIPGRESATFIDRLPLNVSAEPREEIAVPNESADKTLPVLMLTETMGDTGSELLGGGAKLHRIKDFDFKVPRAVVYLDVDTFDSASAENKRVIELAIVEGWPVVIESFSWNNHEVARLTSELFPGVDTGSLTDTSVIVQKSDDGLIATNVSPTEAALKTGIEYSQTSEAKNGPTAIEASSEKASLAKVRAANSHLAYFASLAYDRHLPASRPIPWGNRTWGVAYDGDVVKLFKRSERSNEPQFHPWKIICVVSWRGSHTRGDWGRNFENWLVPWARPGSWTLLVGKGYVDRYNNQIGNFHGSLAECDDIQITGHSLGGGMASLHASIMADSPNNHKLSRLEAYNPARVGYPNWVHDFRNRAASRIFVFCRQDDPVYHMPPPFPIPHQWRHAGNGGGCTDWAPRVVAPSPQNTFGKPNHDMNLWLGL